ncbi:unnamed protein product [Cyprideis torosa]|uniref:Uncharacterized protein n=1 Tax=Cyprideis torosa TaxID=163714 RepID=A0A7R8WQ90_9CRUS|nr:unnamed protein product [Cyprideis torosa]CAG0902654.1 unnamed protein product [Cyprideis torosa]
MFPSKRKGSPSPSHAPAPKYPRRASPWDPPFTGELSPVRRDYHLPCPSTSPDFNIQVGDLKNSLLDTLREVLVTFLLFWAQLKVQVTFQKEGEACSFWFVLPKRYFRQEQDLVEIVEKMLEDAINRIEKQELRGSGWKFTNVEREGVLPFFSDPRDPQRAIDLLFLPHPSNPSGHYVWIKHFSRLVAGETSKHHGTHYTCRRCFSNHDTPETLSRHLLDCRLITSEDGVKKEVPHCPSCPTHNSQCPQCRSHSTLRFDNFKAQQPIPAYLVCDFEARLSSLPPNDPLAGGRGQTTYLRQHIPLSYAIKVQKSSSHMPIPAQTRSQSQPNPMGEGAPPYGWNTTRGIVSVMRYSPLSSEEADVKPWPAVVEPRRGSASKGLQPPRG